MQKLIKYLNIKLLSFIIIALCSVWLPAEVYAKEFIVVIDAGHGGKDHGAVDNGIKEKDINLGVSMKLGELIKKNLKNTKVVFTRNNDTFVSLQGRADKANKVKGDLFISIHTNSVDAKNKNRKSIAGSSVYVLGNNANSKNNDVVKRENLVIEFEKNKQSYQGFDPSSDESYIMFEMAQKQDLSNSIAFAKMAQNELVKTAKRSDRGVHQAEFWVLWATSMPSVLVELDFICNPASAKYLSSENGQEQLAKALFNAIKQYYKDSNGGKGKLSADVSDLSDDLYSQEETVLATRTAKNERVHISRTEKRGRSASARRRRNASDAKKSEESIKIVTDIPINFNDENNIESVSTHSPSVANEVVSANEKATKKKQKKKVVKNSNTHARIDKSLFNSDDTSPSILASKDENTSKKKDEKTAKIKVKKSGSNPKINNQDNKASKDVLIADSNIEKSKGKAPSAANKKTNTTHRKSAKIDHGEENETVTDDASLTSSSTSQKEVTNKKSNIVKSEKKVVADKNSPKAEPKKPRLEKEGKVIYMVKLFSSPSKIKNNDSRLQGLNTAGISVIFHDGRYLYLYGSSEDRSAMEDLRDKLLESYQDAQVFATKSKN